MPESLEVRALRQYPLDARLAHRVTSAYRPGSGSRHGARGTSGDGLAVDFAGPEPAPRGSPEMRAIAEAFLKVEGELYELIYTPLGFSIKRGRRVAPYSINDHYDHVHVAVDRDVMVSYPGGVVPDDPNVPNISGPIEMHLVVSSDGRCTGYYLFSPTTGEIHSWGPGAQFHGRSEVVL